MTDARVAVDPVARQLLGGLLVGLTLLIPLRVALDLTTDGALAALTLAGLLLGYGLGLLLRVAGVPRAVATAAAAGGLFIILVLLGLVILAQLGDPPGDDLATLLVGVPAAALAAVAATAAVQWAQEIGHIVELGICVLAVVLATSLGPAAYGQLDRARDDAETIAELREAGLTPYVPEIDGWEPEFASTGSIEDETVSYTLRYTEPGASWADPVVYVEATTVVADSYQACTEVNAERCRDAGDFLVFGTDGGIDRIVVPLGSTYLVATYGTREGAVPDADELGTALAAAEPVEFDDVVGLH